MISRSTRGMYSEQGFIILMLQHFLIIPFVFIGITVEIAFIDKIFATLFAAFTITVSIILILRLNQITEIYFKTKKTYGKLNVLFMSKITNLANNIPFKKHEDRNEFKKACDDSYDKNIKYQLSQYYLGHVLLLVLDVAIVILLAMMSSGFHIGFEAKSTIDSVIIIQYLLYFLTTLAVVPTLIERWPRSYATSVRLEEVLTLEDKIITQNADNLNKIEIIKEDIGNDEENIFIDRKKALSNILWVVVLDCDFFVQDIAFVPSYSHVS